MSSSNTGAAAFNATALVDGEPAKPPRTSEQQMYLDTLAVEAETAVSVIEEKIAGMRQALDAARERAVQARREAEGD